MVRPSERSILCHFDGLTPLHWVHKLQRYVDSGHYVDESADRAGRHRIRQALFVKEHDGSPEVVQALHDRLRVIPDETYDRLAEMGLVRDLGIDPVRTVNETYGEGQIDLSISGFDAELDRRARAATARAS